MAAPKYGTLVPNRIFVGGISASTSEAELAQVFSAYGNVKATKIISDRAGVSKGYGFVTFETEEEAKRLQQEVYIIFILISSLYFLFSFFFLFFFSFFPFFFFDKILQEFLSKNDEIRRKFSS